MPRDPDLLDRRRPAAAGDAPSTGDRYPFPVPNGWFVVAESAGLAPGEVRALHYFDRDLVLYRDRRRRRPCVLDAHCPHLGAHLAVGGRVEDGCLRCPFHGWRFDGRSGGCVEIPYGDMKRIPPKAHARAYPTLERNHMIWAWYHAQGGEPFYDVPEVPEFHDDDWSPIVVREFEIRVVRPGHGREQRRLLALPLRARHRRHPRRRLRHRRHLQADGGRRGHLRPRGLRARARRAADRRRASRSCRRPRRSTPATSTCAGCSPHPRANGEDAADRRRPTRSAPGSPRTSRSGRTRCTGTRRSSRRPRSSSSSTAAGRSSSTPTRPTERRGPPRHRAPAPAVTRHDTRSRPTPGGSRPWGELDAQDRTDRRCRCRARARGHGVHERPRRACGRRDDVRRHDHGAHRRHDPDRLHRRRLRPPWPRRGSPPTSATSRRPSRRSSTRSTRTAASAAGRSSCAQSARRRHRRGAEAGQAACLEMTQDFGAFAVIVAPAVARDVARCTAVTNETLTIAATGFDQALYDEARGTAVHRRLRHVDEHRPPVRGLGADHGRRGGPRGPHPRRRHRRAVAGVRRRRRGRADPDARGARLRGRRQRHPAVPRGSTPTATSTRPPCSR